MASKLTVERIYGIADKMQLCVNKQKEYINIIRHLADIAYDNERELIELRERCRTSHVGDEGEGK
jgi:hypothetical protein